MTPTITPPLAGSLSPPSSATVHVAIGEDGHDVPPPQLPAFQRFLDALPERCDEAPQVTALPTAIGSYGL
jgi:hypothetical protein